MNVPTAAAFAVATTLGLASFSGRSVDIVGSPAPSIEAGTWFNHIGAPITNETLKGRPVLIEMWATW